jgi:hypothetical protein
MWNIDIFARSGRALQTWPPPSGSSPVSQVIFRHFFSHPVNFSSPLNFFHLSHKISHRLAPISCSNRSLRAGKRRSNALPRPDFANRSQSSFDFQLDRWSLFNVFWVNYSNQYFGAQDKSVITGWSDDLTSR